MVQGAQIHTSVPRTSSHDRRLSKVKGVEYWEKLSFKNKRNEETYYIKTKNDRKERKRNVRTHGINYYYYCCKCITQYMDYNSCVIHKKTKGALHIIDGINLSEYKQCPDRVY
eukprot:360799_1